MEARPLFNPAEWIEDNESDNAPIKVHPGIPANEVEAKVEACVEELERGRIDITSSYDLWLKCGFALASLGEVGRDYFHRISSLYPKYSYAETDRKFTHLIRDYNGKTNIGTFFYFCQEAGIKVFGERKTYICQQEQPRQKHSASTSTSNTGFEDWQDPKPIEHPILPTAKLTPDLLPGPWQEWLTDISYRMQCPIDYAAASALVMTASIVGVRCAIKPKAFDDWSVVPNLWGAIVGKPSQLKTPTMTEVLKIISRMEVEAKAQYDELISVYQAEVEAYKAAQGAIKSEMGKASKKGEALDNLKASFAELPRPEEPKQRRYKTNDSTIEKLAELLSDNPGLLIFRDELIGLFATWDKSGHEPDRAFYLEAWNGTGSITIDRIGRGTTFVESCCVSLLGSIQPDRLVSYLYQTLNGGNDGMMQRLQLLVYPDEPQDYKYVDQYPDRKARTRSYELIRRLAEMDFTQYGAMTTDEDKFPFYRFNQPAQQFFQEWLTKLENEKLRVDDTPYIIEHLAKYRSLMPSLALLFHLIDIADSNKIGPVTLSSARLAAKWCDYLESHARRVYSLVGNITQQAALELTKRIEKGALTEGFTSRDVYRKGWHLLTNKEVVENALSELEQLGWIKSISNGPTGGRPSNPAYQINPKVFSQ